MSEILYYLTLECYCNVRRVILPSFMADSLSFADIEKIKTMSQVTSVSINPDSNIYTVDYLDEFGNCLGRQKIM
jgi:hypothetical protein